MEVRCRFTSSDDVVNHMAMNIGETHVTATEAKCGSLVVHAHQMQHGGVQVVHLDSILNGLIAPLVRRTKHRSRFDAAAGQPNVKPNWLWSRPFEP